MKNLYIKSITFWFVLLIIALFNATLRELTYKPLLTPYIGNWAHQISSATAIILFFIAIYIFLRTLHIKKYKYTEENLILMGIIWIIMTIVFETFMNIYIRKLNIQEVLKTYYFWNGETWIFVLISLIVSPLIINKKLKKHA